MKKLLLSSAAVIAVAAGAPAFAADLPAYEAPMPVETVATVAPLWTGLYVGGQLGYAFGGEDDDDCSYAFDPGSPSPAFGDEGDCDEFADSDDGDHDGSLFAGAHIGYDQQFGSFVVGAVLDANWLFDGHDDDDDFDFDNAIDLDEYEFDVYGDLGDEYAAVHRDELSGVDWYGTARIRAGFAMGRALLYATGGLAFGESGGSSGVTVAGIDAEVEFVDGIADADLDCDLDGGTYYCDLGDDDDYDIDLGWTLGAGVEFLATNNFSVGVEYLYVNLGGDDDGETVTLHDGTTIDFDDGGDNDFHTISLKGSYRFNFGG